MKHTDQKTLQYSMFTP